MSSPIIQTKNLSKIFRTEVKKSGFINRLRSLFHPEYIEYEAVKDITFSVEHGEKIAFLGPNGAGKSTTIKMLVGILTPTSGEISVVGLNPTRDRKKLVYKIGAVFGQVSRLWYHLSSLDTFKLLGKMYGIPNTELRKKLDYLMSEFGIEDFVRNPVRKLSLGQRMRSEVVASLIHSPEIIFLDEPTIGLDMIAKQKLREVINKVNETAGTTIFLTSHDIGDIEHICDRVVIINHGRIVYDGDIRKLRSDHIKTKIIRVRFEDATTKFEPLPFMIIKQQDTNGVEIEIPNTRENLAATFELLNTQYKVEDISVEDPDLEEIIRTFY
ncbi:MAG: ATP-binding cassette domain-containing protein [Candidatus Gracilibacteria bacterium]|nr:ATP-binding cassette domain-containing protein [Candidatus Gracilibacteria bacterium]